MTSKTELWNNVAAGMIKSVAVLCFMAILLAVILPAFIKPPLLPDGMVIDSSGRPLPNAGLQIRDQSGNFAASVTSDREGRFHKPRSFQDLSQATVEGYALTDAKRRTGSGTLYVFSPVGTQTAFFRSASGHALAGLPITMQAGSSTPIQRVTDKMGEVSLNNVPLAARFQMRTTDNQLVVGKVQTALTPQTVRYTVTATPPALIWGRVLSADGRPLKGFKPFATVGPDVEHHNRLSARWLLTSADGSFQIAGLPPGTYFVTAARMYHTLAPVQRVTVAAGQTKFISLYVSL